MSDKIKIEWIECTDVLNNVAVKVEEENEIVSRRTTNYLESASNSTSHRLKAGNINHRVPIEDRGSNIGVMERHRNKGNVRCRQCKAQVPEMDRRKHIFKIWNRTRMKKIMVAVQEADILANVIARASEKLHINGTRLVLHTDGTMVDEDEILLMLKSEIFILLEETERWIPENMYDVNSPLSVASTKTMLSMDESTSQVSFEADETSTNEAEDATNESVSPVTFEDFKIKSPIVPASNGPTSECYWPHWPIPWHKIPQHLLNACKDGVRDKVTMTAICHFVIDEMMSVHSFIPSKALRLVSQKIVERFPQTFQEVDEHGIVTGDGCTTLFSKLRERAAYLRRPQKRKSRSERQLDCGTSGSNTLECMEGGSEDNARSDAEDEGKNFLSQLVYQEENSSGLYAVPSHSLIMPAKSTYSTEGSLSRLSFEADEPFTTAAEDPISINPPTSNSGPINFPIDNLEFVWSNWTIPWHKMPRGLLQACEEGCRDKVTITRICHFIIDEMRSINTYIPSKALRAVTRQIVDRYPKTFRDEDDDGFVLGDGCTTLFSKLHERASYLRRPCKRKTLSEEQSGHVSKRQISVSAGCLNWAPAVYNTDRNNEEDRNRLNAFVDSDLNTGEFYELLETTYVNQRYFLNNLRSPPSVGDIKREWPIIFRKEAIRWHFNKLTGKDLNNLSNNIWNKADLILQYGYTKTKLLTDADGGQVGDVTERCFKFLGRYFREDLGKFWVKCQNTESIQQEIASPNITNLCIAEIDMLKQRQFIIYMDREEILRFGTFLHAFEHLFALYFILNLQYPKDVSTLLEFVQRYFLKIHPDSGTKSTFPNSKKRVINLMKKLHLQ